MAFLTSGGEIEAIVYGMTAWTGSLYISLFMILLIVLVLMFALNLNIEWSAVFIMPLLLTLMTYDAAFYPAGAVLLVYLGILIVSFFMKR